MSLTEYLKVGTPVTHADRANHREGFVSKVSDFEFEIIFPEEKLIVRHLAGSLLEKWLETAKREGRAHATSGTIAAWVFEAHTAKKERDASVIVKIAKDRAAGEAFKAELAERMPEGFKGVVIAELVEDTSDIMSDYHGHKTRATVVIGFTKSARSLFPNMRKAALTFAPTTSLAEKWTSDEHRENYSMGGGTYLKRGWSRHQSGWTIRIMEPEWVSMGKFSPFIEKEFPTHADASLEKAFEAIGLGDN